MFTTPMINAAREALAKEAPAAPVNDVVGVLIAAMEKAMVPAYIYDPDDWEYTARWEDRYLIEEDLELDPGDMRELHTLYAGPPMWAVHVVLTRDEHGDADETGVQWFTDKPEAIVAMMESAHVYPGS